MVVIRYWGGGICIGSPSRFGIDPNDPILLEDPLVKEIATDKPQCYYCTGKCA